MAYETILVCPIDSRLHEDEIRPMRGQYPNTHILVYCSLSHGIFEDIARRTSGVASSFQNSSHPGIRKK